jgi:hypothetical protein
MKKQSLIVGAIVFASSATSLYIGFKMAEKKLAAEFEERLEKETEHMRVFYSQVKKPYPTPQDAVKDLIKTQVEGNSLNANENATQKISYHKIVKAEGYKPLVDPEEEEAIKAEIGELDDSGVQTVSKNIFQSQRDENNPYIISQEEFLLNEPDFQQSTLTYYEKDRTLADEREDVIERSTEIVGVDSFTNFGAGSDDENVVHVRNERLRMDFEIVRSPGAFAQEVLGEDEVIEQRPSARQRRGE